MDDHVTRTFGDLTVRIDRLLCVGFGDCIEVAPEVFEFDDEGIVVFKQGAGEIEPARLVLACDICPVDALSVHDAAGDPVAPR